MNKQAIKEWLKLTEQNKQNIFREVAIGINLSSAAIEKDWWVVRTLEIGICQFHRTAYRFQRWNIAKQSLEFN
jgi:hypothetical protein